MTARPLHVVGARPNFMKAAPVVAASARLGLDPMLVHTGQHYDRRMSEIFFDQLGLPEPDLNLGVGSGSHATQTAALMSALERTMLDAKPSQVVVYGDVNSTMAAALVAAKLLVPVAHVEAGLRSFDRTMPEEINRVVTDRVADMLFAPSDDAVAHLRNEGVEERRIHLVGNSMIDTWVRFRDRLDPNGTRRALGLPDRWGVVTLHRPGNVDDPARATAIVASLAQLASRLALVVPLHPRGRDLLAGAGLLDTPGIAVVDPLGYVDFMSLMAGAALVVTDSGGIQEETSILGIPCLTVRPNTERPITVTAGTNRLVEPAEIASAAAEALAAAWSPAAIALWDGAAGERIAAILAAISSP
jgi:UDP-N-acetylglucosamine 2-epimerase (non-hydrolysing)